MDFEQQLREIGKKIYEKIITFVEENKEDDDLYYDYAFIRLNNGQEIQYDFEKKSIRISTPKDSTWLSNSIIEIVGGDTNIIIDVTGEDDYKCTFINYDTTLNKKIETCDRDNLKLAYKMQLLRQRKLTREEKGQIKSYYKQLSRETKKLTYDKEKTQNVNNFNYDVDYIYSYYMYEKEINKLKESTDKILPAVKIAVDWWADRISITEKKEDIFSWEYRKKGPIPPITPEQLADFKRVLSQKIMAEILSNDGDLVKVGVYDYPVVILYGAMKEAGIDSRRIPVSSLTMYIRAYWVEVEEYREETELYDSTTKEDIEEVKRIYLEQNYSYTLK